MSTTTPHSDLLNFIQQYRTEGLVATLIKTKQLSINHIKKAFFFFFLNKSMWLSLIWKILRMQRSEIYQADKKKHFSNFTCGVNFCDIDAEQA